MPGIKTEPHMQAVVRRVAAELLVEAAPQNLQARRMADQLREADTATLIRLRERIEHADREWSREYRVVAMKHEGVLWAIRPELVDAGDNGELVKLHWGWGAEEGEGQSLLTTGAMALDLARDIAKLFEQEDGEIREPREEKERERDPEFERASRGFMDLASELTKLPGMEHAGSLRDVRAWIAVGKPQDPKTHQWVEYPEDHVHVCEACGEWYRSGPQDDDWGTVFCPGEPLEDEAHRNIDDFDPRRSPLLREAQRLDRLTMVMGKVAAIPEEIEPLLVRLREIEDRLSPDDRKRYDDERVGR